MNITECALVFGDSGAGSLAAAIAAQLSRAGLAVHPTAQVDASDRAQLDTLFAEIHAAGRRLRLVVHAPSAPTTALGALDSTLAEAQQQWRRICYAGSQIGQVAIPPMLATQQGTLLFLAPAASANAAVAAAAAGLRSFAQSMAREFGPKNLHVAYLAVDEAADSAAVAHSCWQLHQQQRTTWTQELDLRA
ncbi:MAG TPA: SDR family oxidoreductase [Solimonas sp.]|nr:SDR family oxidoreductase [Solimonas sp.]